MPRAAKPLLEMKIEKIFALEDSFDSDRVDCRILLNDKTTEYATTVRRLQQQTIKYGRDQNQLNVKSSSSMHRNKS